MSRFLKFIVVILIIARIFESSRAAEPGGTQNPKEATSQTDADWIDHRWSETQIGPFLGGAINTPRRITPKAVAIKVGDDQATVCFDTDLLRFSAGWTGGFLKLQPERYGLINPPAPQGEIQFTTSPQPGWSENGSFADPRPNHLGPLPRAWAHYKGLYLSGKRVVLSYSVGSLEILDSPGFEMRGEIPVFTRTLEIKGIGRSIVRICDDPESTVETSASQPQRLTVKKRDGSRLALVLSGSPECQWAPDGTAANLHIQSKASVIISVAIYCLAQGYPVGGSLAAPAPESLQPFLHGGLPRWTNVLETKGVLGRNDGPFSIDTITMPYANPWNALMFASGHDFLDDGRAVLATIHGDVWLVSGIDQNLHSIQWKRFATGLYHPLGLKVLRGKIYVMEHDQITVLHDLNGDDEADFYENFNNDCLSTGQGHTYATCLETDDKGNFYFLKCSEPTPYGGSVLRVTADGSRLDVLASGFRNPNGMAVGPDNMITVADQQGNWVPETRLDIIKPGGFYGFMPMYKGPQRPQTFEQPLCWIPRPIDNSAGGQVWIPQGTWGPLSGRMLHLSYGRCTFMSILQDRFDPANGGIVPLPGRFLSGVMRARFNPKDGALYLSGLRGWQTAAVKDGCFQRVRYSGKPLLIPVSFGVQTNSIQLTFDQPLSRELAQDVSSYTAEEWNYRWSENYGSADYSPSHPDKTGRDRLEIASATLTSANTVTLIFKNQLSPVNSLRLTYSLETGSGDEIRGDFFATINHIGAGH